VTSSSVSNNIISAESNNLQASNNLAFSLGIGLGLGLGFILVSVVVVAVILLGRRKFMSSKRNVLRIQVEHNN